MICGQSVWTDCISTRTLQSICQWMTRITEIRCPGCSRSKQIWGNLFEVTPASKMTSNILWDDVTKYTNLYFFGVCITFSNEINCFQRPLLSHTCRLEDRALKTPVSCHDALQLHGVLWEYEATIWKECPSDNSFFSFSFWFGESSDDEQAPVGASHHRLLLWL